MEERNLNESIFGVIEIISLCIIFPVVFMILCHMLYSYIARPLSKIVGYLLFIAMIIFCVISMLWMGIKHVSKDMATDDAHQELEPYWEFIWTSFKFIWIEIISWTSYLMKYVLSAINWITESIDIYICREC